MIDAGVLRPRPTGRREPDSKANERPEIASGKLPTKHKTNRKHGGQSAKQKQNKRKVISNETS